MVSPVNTSRLSSRTTAHDSGPERLARPYSVRDLHPLFFASFTWRTKRCVSGTLFVEDGRLRVDNNLTENVIRPFVIGRKNYLFRDTVARASANRTHAISKLLGWRG